MSRGVYTVILRLPSAKHIMIGRLGTIYFEEGFYSYTGSAMGRGGSSLEGRISRYLDRSIHRPFWHIDYLLMETFIEVVVYAECSLSFEHIVASTLSRKAKPIIGFGSSDCRYGCKAHLHYLGLDRRLAIDTVVSVYSDLGLEARIAMHSGDIFKLEEIDRDSRCSL